MSESPQSFHDFGALGQGIHAHGTRKNFAAGCRCTPCRAVESAYQAMRQQARANGLSGWIDAEPCRQHIALLRSKRLGLGQIAFLADVSVSTVQAIAEGKPRVSRKVAERILATRPQLALGVVINRYRTSHLVRCLLGEGYTRDQLEALGLPRCAFQFQNERIKVKTAAIVRAWFRKLTSEDAV